MDLDGLMELRERFWEPGASSLQRRGLAPILGLIEQNRPEKFLEIGTATGLTTGLLAHMLEANGGHQVVTVDIAEQFYQDPSKRTGYVIDQVYPPGPVKVEQHTGKTSLDVIGLGHEFEIGFVDGNHLHPWPLIDTVCIYPVLTGPRLLIHDDLNLYRVGGGRRVGPKILFDQLPETHRTRFGVDGNNYVVDLTIDRGDLERRLADALHMPWMGTRPSTADLGRFREVVSEHFSPWFLGEVDSAVARFGPEAKK